MKCLEMGMKREAVQEERNRGSSGGGGGGSSAATLKDPMTGDMEPARYASDITFWVTRLANFSTIGQILVPRSIVFVG
jgi:hypothetical protein